MAEMTLPFARSPEAPKKTTLQGSDAPRTLNRNDPCPQPSSLPPSSCALFRNLWQRPKLYLNPILSKLRAQLHRVLMVNGVHPQAPRAFQVQRPVINEKTLPRLALRNSQGTPKNHLFGLPGSNITRAEENQKVSSKV